MKRGLLLFVLMVICSISPAKSGLKEGFLNPPNGAKPEVWWHWTSEDLNKEGMKADLESMKKVGIDRAYIFFTGGAGEGIGLTPFRLDLYRFAAEEAKRLGLTLGMHNCPGWSSSGGPWVTPEYSMKGLVYTESVLAGGKEVRIKLPQPPTRLNYYRDVAVLALPITEGPFTPDLLVDGKKINSEGFQIPVAGKGTKSVLECRFDQEISVRSLGMIFPTRSLNVGGYIEGIDNAGKTQKIADFRIRKYGWLNHPEPNTWQIIPLGDQPQKGETLVRAKTFRVHFLGQDGKEFPVPVKKVRFFQNSMITDVDQRNSSTDRFGYQKPDRPEEAGISPQDVLDLSDKMGEDGTLIWNAPAGNYTVLRIGCTALGKMCAPAHANLRGLECDKLARSGIDEHWKHMMVPILKQTDPYQSLRACLIDSYEMGGQNWTIGLDKIFEQKRGYNMKKFFPALFGYTIGSAADSAAFLYDYQRTVSDCFVENYYDRFDELCKSAGLLSSCESYNGPFDNLQCAHKIPLAVTEFWVGGGGLGTRYSASAARIHGHTVNGAESFTAEPETGRWQQDPRQLKRYGDKAWIEGVNLLILHSYVCQPYGQVKPGMTLMQYGTHFGRNNTWWDDSKGWMDYMARGQYLLQSGRSTSELLILAGESRPNACRVLRDLTLAGYDYDYCDAETIHKRLSAKNGKIHIEGALGYDLFFLGNELHPSLATLRVVKKLLDGGAFVAGQKPICSPSLAEKSDQEEYDRLVQMIWADKKYKNFAETNDPLEALKQAGVISDFQSTNKNMISISRKTDQERIFFIMNTSPEESFGKISFGVSGMVPEFWDPMSGSISDPPVWTEEDGRIEIPVKLAANGSIFVVFSQKEKESDHPIAIAKGEITPDSTNRLTVLEAKYRRVRGDLDGGVDVLDRVQKSFTEKGLSLEVKNHTLGKRDPYPNQVKELMLRYRINGKEKTSVYAENSSVYLPHVPEGTYIANHFEGPKGPCAEFTEPGTYSLQYKSGKILSAQSDQGRKVLSLNEDWKVEFAKDLGAPTGEQSFKTLISWTDRPEFGIKYFSGSAVYRKTVSVSAQDAKGQNHFVLDLGEVKNLARVSVNGKDLGVLWTPPFAMDITTAIKPGENRIEIKVVNLWVNRMIGDEFHPTANQTEKPDWVMKGLPNSGDGRYTWASWKGWTKEDQPLESGLLGPVSLEIRPVRPLK
ncbi:MAG: glycosyl hydrolase [Planctomycetia bacterium]|nr:glycosyl hydrolase [Planctomycetia bacterium]